MPSLPLRRLAAAAAGAALAVALLPSSSSAAAPRSLDTGCPADVVGSSGFLDDDGSAHERAIACLVHWGVTTGVTVTRFSPATPVDRGQTASFVFRALTRSGGALPAGEDAFADDDGSVHEPAIDALAAAGVVAGGEDGRYGPAAPVSRAQMAALLVRAYDERAEQAGRPPLPAGPDAFPDDDGATLEPEVDRAAAAGFVAGFEDGTYRPADPVTREAMASFVARWLDLAVAEGLTAVPPRPAAVRLVAVGDIACPAGATVTATRCAHGATAELTRRIDPEGVLLLGDVQYESGTVEEFSAEGGWTGTWSTLLDRSWPTAGNHEWNTEGAAGYRSVFDGRTGGRWFYSFDVGGWHVVSLDSNCGDVGGCGAGSPGHRFLVDDLAAHDGKPTVVFWHHPRWATGDHGSYPSVADLWATAAADPDVQLVLAAHDHSYERFGPIRADGSRGDDGVPSLVVGTGGKSLDCDRTPGPASEVFDCSTPGVLALALRPDGWDFELVGTVGTFTDAGSRPLRSRP